MTDWHAMRLASMQCYPEGFEGPPWGDGDPQWSAGAMLAALDEIDRLTAERNEAVAAIRAVAHGWEKLGYCHCGLCDWCAYIATMAAE